MAGRHRDDGTEAEARRRQTLEKAVAIRPNARTGILRHQNALAAGASLEGNLNTMAWTSLEQ
jgi:hypothetical protein